MSRIWDRDVLHLMFLAAGDGCTCSELTTRAVPDRLSSISVSI